MPRLKTSQTPLTPEERKKRRRCHRKIVNYLKSKIGAAEALAEMHREKLFRPLTWGEYCRWIGMSPTRAYGLMRFFEIYRLLAEKKIHPLPKSEGQTRPLQSLPDDDVVAVWKIAAECEKTVPERTVAAARTAYYHANPDRPQPQKPCKKEATTAAPRPRILSSVGRWLSMLWLLIVRAFLWLVGRFSAGKKGGP